MFFSQEDADTIYRATGLTVDDFNRPMFESLIVSSALVISAGYDPMDIWDYQLFNYDAQMASAKCQQICTMVGFDANRIDDGAYVAEGLNRVVEQCEVVANQQPSIRKVPVILAVAIAREACYRHSAYKEDFARMAPFLVTMVRG